MTRLAIAALLVALCGPALARDLVQKFAAQYPIRALDRGIEGWIEVGFEIAADGTVVAPKVLAAMPKGTFDKSALAAVAKWRYAPGASEREPATAMLTFSALSGGAARAAVMDKLSDAARMLQDGKATEAVELLGDIEGIGGLTLAELAVLERVRGLSHYQARRFAEAAACFNRVLEMFGPRMEPKAVTAVLETLIPARINSGAFADAVAAADRWLADGQALSPAIDQALATIRPALASGRPITLTAPP